MNEALSQQQVETILKQLSQVFGVALPGKQQVRLSEFRDEYLRLIGSTKSKSYQRSVALAFCWLLKFKGDILLSEIDFRFVDLFMSWLIKEVPRGSFNYFRNLRAAFSHAEDWGYISKNPFKKFRYPKHQKLEKSVFTFEEFYKLIEQEKKSTLKLLFEFSFLTGLRLAEVTFLEWNSVHLQKEFVLIGSENFSTKNRKTRRVYLSERAKQVLIDILPKTFPINKKRFVFSKDTSGLFPYSKDYISKRFKRLLKEDCYSGNYSFHSLRHSFVSNLSAAGVPVDQIRELSGHSSISILQTYLHTNSEQLQSAVRQFDNQIIRNHN
jgi:integrase